MFVETSFIFQERRDIDAKFKIADREISRSGGFLQWVKTTAMRCSRLPASGLFVWNHFYRLLPPISRGTSVIMIHHDSQWMLAGCTVGIDSLHSISTFSTSCPGVVTPFFFSMLQKCSILSRLLMRSTIKLDSTCHTNTCSTYTEILTFCGIQAS